MCKQILTSGYSVKLSMGFLSVITKIHGFILRSAIAMAETERLSENKKNLYNCDESRCPVTSPFVSLVCSCTVYVFLNMWLYDNCYGISSHYLYPSCSNSSKSFCKSFKSLLVSLNLLSKNPNVFSST